MRWILPCLLWLGCAGPPAPAVDPTPISQVTGTVTHPAAPLRLDDARATITVVDVTNRGGVGVVLGTQVIDPATELPLDYVVRFDPADLKADRKYEVRARITRDGRLIFLTTGKFPVLTHDHPNSAEVILTSVGG